MRNNLKTGKSIATIKRYLQILKILNTRLLISCIFVYSVPQC